MDDGYVSVTEVEVSSAPEPAKYHQAEAIRTVTEVHESKSKIDPVWSSNMGP